MDCFYISNQCILFFYVIVIPSIEQKRAFAQNFRHRLEKFLFVEFITKVTYEESQEGLYNTHIYNHYDTTILEGFLSFTKRNYSWNFLAVIMVVILPTPLLWKKYDWYDAL